MRVRLSKYVIAIFYITITLFIFVQYQRSGSSMDEEPIRAVTDILPSCKCISRSGNIYDFCYSLPENGQKGKRFDCKYVDKWERLLARKLGNYIDPVTDPLPDPVFVTAFSAGFLRNGLRLIHNIRATGSNQKIVIYDLGIWPKELVELQKSCNVEIRKFDFSIYPSYFKNLKTYRWKPVVIAETLADFGAIWYLDSSVIFEGKNVSHVYDLINCQKTVFKRSQLASISKRDEREREEEHESGWNKKIWRRNLEECRKSTYLLHGYSGHGIYSVTNPEVYKYLPTNPDEMKKPKAKMYDAGFVYAVNTEKTMQYIVKWYLLCALEEGCMAPGDSQLNCNFVNDDRFQHYARCHRFDQSIINMLLANTYWYDRRYYVSEIVDFFHIERSQTKGNWSLECS